MGHWLYEWLGLSGTGPVYGFWSGFGSDIGEVTIFGMAYALFRKVNCHQHRCWRIGRHPVDGTPFVARRKHHPDLNMQRIDIAHHSKVLREGRKP